MHSEDQDDGAVYTVVVNAEEQYSIWPLHLQLPVGWTRLDCQGPRDECLAYVRSVWTDIRPASLRRAIAEIGGDDQTLR